MAKEEVLEFPGVVSELLPNATFRVKLENDHEIIALMIDGPNCASTNSLFKAVGNPTLGQIIGGHFDLHLIAGQNTDAVLAHLSCRMCDDLMAILKLDPKRRIGQEFLHDTGEFEDIFLGHVVSIVVSPVTVRVRAPR